MIALAITSCGVTDAPGSKPNILLIVVDSLRADRLDPAGGQNTPAPFLSRLAMTSRYYENAYSPSSWTLPSVASLFTARYPSQHGMSWWFRALADENLTLAEVLSARGYRTGAISAHAGIADSQHNCQQGFDDFIVAGSGKMARPGDASEVNAAALDWLDAERIDPTAPYLLYLHYMDPHIPYRAHSAHRKSAPAAARDQELNRRVSAGSFAKGEAERTKLWNFAPRQLKRLQFLYDGEVRYLDKHVAKLLKEFEKRKALENTIIIVTADHGEEFGEHRVFGHATTLHHAVVNVPLIVRIPHEPASRALEPVEIGGIAPTLLKELGIPIPKGWQIPSFSIRSQSSATDATPAAYVELLETKLGLRLHERAVFSTRGALLVAPGGQETFYPGNGIAADSDLGTRTHKSLRSTLADRSLADRTGTAAATVAEPHTDTVEQLRALGYLEEPEP